MKIKSRYFRPISSRRFDAMKSMLADARDLELLNEFFQPEENAGGNLRYQLKSDIKTSSDKTRINELARLLKGIHKARSGPRKIRLILVLVILLGPLIFNLFFLDSWASRRLETLLEAWSGTDVTIEGLDISIFKVQASLDHLAFASPDDPMLDAWVVENLLFDADLNALLRRRFVLDSMEGAIKRDVLRDTRARYPRSRESQVAQSTPVSIETPDFLIDTESLLGEMNFASLALAEELRTETVPDLDQRYRRISQEMKEEIEAGEKLLADVRAYVSAPAPSGQNIQEWTEYVRQGSMLAEKLESTGKSISAYQAQLQEISELSSRLAGEITNSLDKDLLKIRQSLSLDSSLVDNLIRGALLHYAGKRALAIYEKYGKQLRPVLSRLGSDAAEKEPESVSKRTGRHVSFPVTLPPRFSIRELVLSGEGIEIEGRDIGVDHDLAGAPSVLALHADGKILGNPASDLNVSLIIDGRDSAKNTVSGTYNLTNLPWQLDSGALDGLGGVMSLDGSLDVPEVSGDDFSGDFSVELNLYDWASRSGSEFVSSLATSAPPTGLRLSGRIVDRELRFTVIPDPGIAAQWSNGLLKALIPGGSQALQDELESSLDTDLSFLSGIQQGSLDDIQNATGLMRDRSAIEKELEARIQEKGSGQLESAIGGLKSLF